MLTIRNSFGSLAIIGGFIGSLNIIQAAGTIKPVQSVSADDMNVMLQAVEATTPVAAESVPRCGLFYSALMPMGPPLPGSMGWPAWNLGEDSFGQSVWLLDDLDQPQAQMRTMAGTRMTMDVPTPGDGGDDGTNTYTFNASSFTVDYGTNLWIAQVGISSGSLFGIVSNSVADIYYEIQSCENLLGGWSSEGVPVYGSETASWTPFSVAMNNRTNLFVRIKSWADSTGSGIPDWWWLQYFGQTTNVDAYANPASDGWNNLEKFLGGMNPNVFYTPPAPQGLTASFNVDNTATVNWQPSPGPVTGYTVQRDYITYDSGYHYQTFNLSAGSVSLQDATPFNSPWWVGARGLTVYVSYKIQAHYAGGDSAWSSEVQLEPETTDITLVPGSQGSVYFAARNLPVGTTALRLTRLDYWMESQFGDSPANAVSFDIPLSTGTNGLYLIPAEDTTSSLDAYGYAWYGWFVQPVNANGQGTSQANSFDWGFYSDLLPQYWIVPPYFDGRAQLKQNLIFLLRAATVDSPFYYNGFGTNQVYTSCFYAYTVTNPATYAYSAFNSPFGIVVNYSGGYGYIQNGFDVFSPFQNNYLYRNFVFNMADLSGYRPPFYSEIPGQIMTGVAGSYEDTGFFGSHHGLGLVDLPTYHFMPPTTSGVTISAMLATDQTQWLCSYPLDSPEMYYDPATDSMVSYGYLEEIGVTPSVDAGWNQWETMAANARNVYGLPFLSAKIAWGNTSDATYTLSAGSQVENVDGYFYPQTAQPLFQTVEYDFWNRSPLPGSTNFSTSQASDLLIAGVDSFIGVNGYAKLAVSNGYPGVYAYLGQYFDQAYKIDANGVVTTNTTGVLSPYGSFFATEPGPAALVTMPDVDTGARGTCTVYCVSAQVDKNFDGTMDLSFNGPDATSQASPMEFWVNSGHCEPGKNGNLDTDLPVPPNSTNYSRGKITCQRDLENFARLWICGMPSLPLYQNYTVTLSMSLSSGNPAINLYWSCETNGGTSYLTDTNIAAQQIAVGLLSNYGTSIGTVSNNCSCTFPEGTFLFGGTRHLLFEGAGIGSGQLTLTISQNGNTLAQTGVWLDLHDIRDFFEVAKITNNASGAISNWTSAVETVLPATSSVLGDDTNLIVFVHGINVDDWHWIDASETVFKRLYWAGYHGKFMTVKWPCNFLTPPSPVTLAVFNLSEANAYKASTSLATYLNQLRSRFPGYRLNLFVHSQGNAVASEAIKNGAPFDTYIITQGAISDGAYDVNATNYPPFMNEEVGKKITPEWQPMGYHGVYTNSNFAGKIVNFYNTNDPVLAVWIVDQVDLKPSGGYFYDGVNCRYTISTNIIVTDFQETRSMVSRSRSLSVGQSGPASAHGVIKSAVDLNANFGFNNASFDDHSAQWAWPIQTSLSYYYSVLSACNISTHQLQ
jgi:hypothetical protein